MRSAGQTPPQQVTGELVGFICPASPSILSSDLQDRCNDIAGAILSGGDISGALAGLQAMAPEENSAVQTIEVEGSPPQTDELRERLEQRRKEEDEEEETAINITIDGKRLTASEILGSPRGGGASADNLGSGRLGVFLNGNFGLGDKDTTLRETGFDLNSYGVTGGVDYRLSDQSLVGLAVGYTTQDVDLDSNSGSLDTDGISGSLYGSYYPSPQSYINAIASYSATDHDQERNIIYTIAGTASIVNQTAFSDTDSDEIAGSLEAGYDFYRGRWTMTPYARLDVAHTEIDGFTEILGPPAPGTVNSDFALQIDDQAFTSVTTAIGGRVLTAISAKSFDVFPQVGVEYVHEFDNDNEDTTGRLVQDTSGSTFLLPTDEPDRNYGSVSAGLTTDFRNGWYGHFLYQGLIGYEDLAVHAFEVGARLQF
ncbi:MAG: autotransporter outer membrane beta-barrel domain-containing protein [Chromatiales bacterium]